MNLIINQISQMIQDVHDGEESVTKATTIIQNLESYLNLCKIEIEDLVLIENGRVHKDNNQGEII